MTTVGYFYFYYVANMYIDGEEININDPRTFTNLWYNPPIDYIEDEKHYFDIIPKYIYLN